MVIHPPKEVHNYDAEFTITLGDWYHDEQPDLLKQFVSVANPGGAEPVPGLYFPGSDSSVCELMSTSL